jgi:hypothetical protein
LFVVGETVQASMASGLTAPEETVQAAKALGAFASAPGELLQAVDPERLRWAEH